MLQTMVGLELEAEEASMAEVLVMTMVREVEEVLLILLLLN